MKQEKKNITAGSGSFRTICGEFQASGEKQNLFDYFYTPALFLRYRFCVNLNFKNAVLKTATSLVLDPIVLPVKDKCVHLCASARVV